MLRLIPCLGLLSVCLAASSLFHDKEKVSLHKGKKAVSRHAAKKANFQRVEVLSRAAKKTNFSRVLTSSLTAKKANFSRVAIPSQTAEKARFSRVLISRHAAKKRNSSGGELRTNKASDHFAQEKKLLFVGIISAPTHVSRRNEIRNSWMKFPFHTLGVKVRFVVGQPKRREKQELPDYEKELKALDEEDKAHQDIVRVAAEEDYRKLTQKVLAFYQWFAKNRKEQFLLKMDDDVFVRFNRLVPFLRNSRADYSLMGYMFPCAPVLRQGPWAEDRSTFDKEFFPKYAQGSAYVLSAALLRKIVEPKQAALKILHNEDAAVGVWIETLKQRNPAMKVEFIDVNSTLYGCSEQDVFSMNIRPGGGECMWENIQAGSKQTCCQKSLPVRPPHGALLQVYNLGAKHHKSVRLSDKRKGMGAFPAQVQEHSSPLQWCASR